MSLAVALCTLHGAEYVDGLQTHIARSSYAATGASAAAVSDCTRNHLDMVTCYVLRDDCSATDGDHVDRNQVPKHRHVKTLALNIFFGHVDMTQCEQCVAITALLSGFVTRSATFSSLRTRSLLDLTSSCIHKYAT